MLITVCKDGLYGYIDRTGKLVIEPQYTEALPMKENKAEGEICGNFAKFIDKS